MLQRIRRHVFIWLGWSVPALFLAAFSIQESGSIRWANIISHSVPWYFWALFTLPIVAHAHKYPPETLRSSPGIMRHVITGIALGVLCGFVAMLTAVATGAGPGRQSLLSFFISGILFWCMFGLIFYSLITSVGFVLVGQRRLREREVLASQLEARLVAAQLHGLRMQLQPHFLFNTLNTVAMYVRDGDAATSIRVLTRLSELLRRVLDTEQEQEVPLSVEIEHATRYLEIETVRFSDRLRVEFDVPADLSNAVVPNLALQPLVENAIRHGIAKRGEEGHIRVSARSHGEQLIVQVYNEGPALPDNWEMRNANGIGLRNTSMRLQHLYGDRGQLNVMNMNGGVISEIRLPLRRVEAGLHA